MPSMPFPSTPPPRARIRDPPAGGRSRRSATAAGLFGSGDPERLLDPRHDPRFSFRPRRRGGPGPEPRPPVGARVGAPRLRGYLAVETPSDCSIFVTIPVSGSKNCLVIVFQPPSESIVNRPGGVGNLEAPGTPVITGR